MPGLTTSESHPEQKDKLPSVSEMFGRPVRIDTGDADTRGKLLDKTISDENIDAKFDLSTEDGEGENRFLFLFARADTYAKLIKERYGSKILSDFLYTYKKQSMSKGRASRREMVDIIAGRNFPDFDDIKNEVHSSSLVEKLRGVIRR